MHCYHRQRAHTSDGMFQLSETAVCDVSDGAHLIGSQTPSRMQLDGLFYCLLITNQVGIRWSRENILFSALLQVSQ